MTPLRTKMIEAMQVEVDPDRWTGIRAGYILSR